MEIIAKWLESEKEIPKNTKGVVYILQSLKDIDGIYRFGQTVDLKKDCLITIHQIVTK